MTNIFIGDGEAGITSPTVGDITTSKIRVLIRNATIPSTSSSINEFYIGVSGDSGGTREFGLYRTPTSMMLAAGGQSAQVFEFASAYPEGVENKNIDFVLNVDGTFSFKVGTDAPITGSVARGVARIDGAKLVLGGRGKSIPNDPVIESPLGMGASMGDTVLFIDDILVRNYHMPPSGTYVKEMVNGLDGSVTKGTVLSFQALAKDPLAPKIALVNAPFETVTVNSVYNDMGAIATDPTDGDLTTGIITTGSVNTGGIGLYDVTYHVTNSLNFTQQVSKRVAVSNKYSVIPANINFANKDFPSPENVLSRARDIYPSEVLFDTREFYADYFGFTLGIWLAFNVDAHRMTGENSYITRGIAIIDHMFASVDTFNPLVTSYTDGPEAVYWATPFVKHIGWSRNFAGGRRVEVLLDGQICRNIMLFVDYVKTEGIIQFDVDGYIDKCEAIMDTHETSWRDYKYGGDGVTPLESGKIVVHGSYYYPSNKVQGQVYSAPVPVNHTSVALIGMYYIAKYKNRPDYIQKNQAFTDWHVSVARLEDYGTQYMWQYLYSGGGESVVNKEDIGHAAYSMSHIKIARQQGWISQEDHEKMLKTAIVFTDQFGNAGQFLDGTGSSSESDVWSLATGFFDAAAETNLNTVRNLTGEAVLNRATSERSGYIFPLAAVARVMAVSGLTGSTPSINNPPTSDAGTDQEVSTLEDSITVQLAGTATDPDNGQTVSSTWEIVTGINGVFSDDTSPTSTVTFPVTDSPSVNVLRLTTVDSDQYITKEDSDDVVITVGARRYESLIDVKIASAPGGVSYAIIFLDRTTKNRVAVVDSVLTEGEAVVLVPVITGTELDYFIETFDNVAGDKGVTY